MLTNAACNEDRFYRMMKESLDIAMSKRLCVVLKRHMPQLEMRVLINRGLDDTKELMKKMSMVKAVCLTRN
ncbi:hypothetical protein CCR75_002462 [Bremia lactucae]|uniref:Uncharacterized protein n=1 Tax=Bremia lactucae TaxID=4779 RepID=A0A976FD84_BRELC|nr:hypothetical protein CCR75_002462 [Bremia lactucae]